MDQLTYTFECLYGSFEFKAEIKDKQLHYSKYGSIPSFENAVGMLEEEKTEEFLKELELSGIERWDVKYEATGLPIEDAVKWSVTYEKDGITYYSEGEETYEPYGYEHLIKAIEYCEDKASYFLAMLN